MFDYLQTHDGALGKLGIGILIINLGFAIFIGFIQPNNFSIVFSVSPLRNFNS